MNVSFVSSQDIIDGINKTLKNKTDAVINIINDKLTVSVFALLEQNLRNVKEINFIIRDSRYLPKGEEVSREFEININDVLFNSYDITEKNKLQHFYQAKAMHDFIKKHVNVKRVTNACSVKSNLICIDNNFMFTGQSSLEMPDKRNSSVFAANFDAIVTDNDETGKEQIARCSEMFNQLWYNEQFTVSYKEELLDSLHFVYKEHSPELLYYFTLNELFGNQLDQGVERFERDSDKFKKTEIWNALYDFQKDCVVSAIRKLQKYRGCIRYKSFTKDLRARIEIFSQDQGGKIRFKSFDVLAGASLEELSGGLSQYKNMFIASQPHKLQPLYISAPAEDIYLEQGQSNYEFEPNETVRIQIKLAIRSHFDKQFELLKNGKKIKALSLFFIDSVAKVRDNDAPDGRGAYLLIFDEEYQKAIKAYKGQFEKYKEYFPDYENVQQVREGYFAVDKKNNAVDIAGWDSDVNDEDVKLNAKSQEDIDRGVELILEKKDELISFNEPLAFIFSHSALREGWDNPNVFTLCTLKASGSDIAKKQEIGRGLRLPVDITGDRCIDSNLNELTVIANDYYDHFAEVLQKDFNDSMNFNKNEITADILISTLKNAGVSKALVTAELVDSLKSELIQNGICNKDNVIKNTPEQTTKLLDKLTFSDERLAEHTELIKKEFVKLMTKKGSRKVEITNGDNEPYENKIRAFVTEDEFKSVYANLCTVLQKKTIYVTDIDKDAFIRSCCKEINEFLEYQHITNTYLIEESHGKFDDAAQFKLSHDSNKDRTEVKTADAEKKSDFEIVNYIMSQTMLPRLAIFKILKGIFKRELLNDQDILEKVTQKIKDTLKSISAENITHYEVIDGYETDSANIFELDTITEQDFEKEWRVFHSNPNRKAAINEYYKMDSEGEKIFADKLESNENILMFTKLKKGGFVIATPYGNYSPDWAIICRKDGVEKPELVIYFIVETKINKDHDALTQVEVNKIKCGQLHFKAVSDLVKFNWVKSYEDFKAKFGVKENEV